MHLGSSHLSFVISLCAAFLTSPLPTAGEPDSCLVLLCFTSRIIAACFAFLCEAAYLAAFRCFKAPKEEPFWWKGWGKIHLKRWQRGKSLGQVREVRKPAHPLNQRQEPSNCQPVWSKTIDPNAVSPSQFSILEPAAGLSAHPGLNSSSHTLPLPFIAFFPVTEQTGRHFLQRPRCKLCVLRLYYLTDTTIKQLSAKKKKNEIPTTKTHILSILFPMLDPNY